MQIPIFSENSPTTIELYNLKGQKVLTKEFSRYNSAPISLSNNLANQVYVMRIKNGDKVFTRKFMPDVKIHFVGNFANTNKISTNETLRFPEIQYQTLLREEPLGDSVTNIIFINGMRNTIEIAENSLDRIRAAYAERLKTNEYPGDYKFTLGYNQTHSETHDFAEVRYQWETEFNREANVNELAWLAPIIGVEYYEEAMGISIDSPYSQASNFIKKNFLDRVTEFKTKYLPEREKIVESHKKTTDDLRKIMDESFENRQRVIIIAHSQGNLFANELIAHYYNNNKDKKMLSTEVLNIAPPTISPSKSWWWYTNKDDHIINTARLIHNPYILMGYENESISGKDPRDFMRHGFWESYFHDNLRSRQLIDKVFFKYCKELPFWSPYHPDDVAQINKLIEENGLDLEYDKPENWSGDSISWTDKKIDKRVTLLRASGILGDVSLDLPMLDTLDFENGEISSLDLSVCSELKYLNVSKNQLDSLNLLNNTAITYLNVGNNNFTELNLSNSAELTYLNADNNQLTKLNLTNNKALTDLWVRNNKLDSLDLWYNTSLTYLNASDNQLVSLNLWNNTALKTIFVRNNRLELLNVSTCAVLTTLNANSNRLGSLDVSNNPMLEGLWVTYNHLTSLNVSNNPVLEYLSVDYNRLTSLNVSNNPMLKIVSCLGNMEPNICK
jgi:hypothetical protein